MSAGLDQHNELIEKLADISRRFIETEKEIFRISSEGPAGLAGRIAYLEETLDKIDEYMRKVKDFQKLAMRNLDSLNILTIEAPPGYRVSLNRLKNWAMMIDPLAADDPFARRVYAVAKCDEFFLQKKREEMEARIAELRADREGQEPAELTRLKEELEGLKEEWARLTASEEIRSFAEAVIEETDQPLAAEGTEL